VLRALVVVALVLALLAMARAYAEVAASPATVTFDAYDQSASVALTSNGQPVPASDIEGWKVLASGHDYAFMLDVKKADGTLAVRPSKLLEVGSYDLVVNTKDGPVTITVYAPLRSLPDALAKRAEALGVSTEELKTQLGLTTTLPHPETEFMLPPVYYEGQTLTMTMPSGAQHDCVWTVNGAVVKEGAGADTIEYTFPRPGVYVVTYAEKDNGNVVFSAKADTSAVPLPALPCEIKAGTELTLNGPEGYRTYQWKLDGAEVDSTAKYTHKYTLPGHYVAECLATGPLTGPMDGFLHYRFDVTVK
jgi:hypothetical protein